MRINGIMLVGLMLASCTKLEGVYKQVDDNSLVEIYKDKDAGKLYFKEVSNTPDKTGNYDKRSYEMTKQEDGNGYSVSVGLGKIEIYPSDDGKIKIKAGKDILYSRYEKKSALSRIPESINPKIMEKVKIALPTRYIPDSDLFKNQEMLISVHQDIVSANAPKIEIKDIKVQEDYLRHTRFQVTASASYGATKANSKQWNSCESADYSFVEKWNVCVKCPKGTTGWTKAGESINCVEGRFWGAGKVLGKGEQAKPIRKMVTASTEPTQLEVELIVLVDKDNQDQSVWMPGTSPLVKNKGLDITDSLHKSDALAKIFGTKIAEEVSGEALTSH